jgi:hypothetical protein
LCFICDHYSNTNEQVIEVNGDQAGSKAEELIVDTDRSTEMAKVDSPLTDVTPGTSPEDNLKVC